MSLQSHRKSVIGHDGEVVFTILLITLVNTQNVSVTKTLDSSSIQCAETKYGLRIQFLALVFMIHEVWLNA